MSTTSTTQDPEYSVSNVARVPDGDTERVVYTVTADTARVGQLVMGYVVERPGQDREYLTSQGDIANAPHFRDQLDAAVDHYLTWATSTAWAKGTITFEQELTYRVVITRADGAKWPLLETPRTGRRYDIREVEVRVDVFPDGTFDVHYPDVRRGNTYRQDGKLGAEAPRFLTYMSHFNGDQVDVKMRELMTEALRVAKERFEALTRSAMTLTAEA